MGTWLRRLSYLLHHARRDAELREEIDAHRALRAAQLERDGMTPQQAAAASRRALGNALLARDDAREVWFGSWEAWWQDVRYGVRACRRSPTFTAAAVVTLALGIGVNTGIFTVVNSLLFRDPSAPRAHELVALSLRVEGADDPGGGAFSAAEYYAYGERVRTLSGVAAYGRVRGGTTLVGDVPRTILGGLVSCNFLDVLQQPPALGRALTPRDCEPGADPVVILDDALWRTTFGADPNVVGRTIRLNRATVTVVGVAAADTYNPSPVQGGFFAPLTTGRVLSPADSRHDDDQSRWLNLLGRRADGVGLDQVRAELAVVAAQLDRQRPGQSTRVTAERATAAAVAALPGPARQLAAGGAAVLMGAFGLILLIACANVANLLLARGTARTQEIGVRVSLGASRARIVRQLLAESLVLALAGGLLGSALALWSFQVLVTLAIPALQPPEFTMTLAVDVSPDVRVLGFAVALTVATGMLFGLAPAWHVSRADLHTSIKQDSASITSNRRGGRLRGVLVGAEVALCMVLMVSAGLLLRGLYATYTTDPGFEYRDVAYVSLESPDDSDEWLATRRRLIDEVRTLPGVEAVATADQEPLGDDTSPFAIRVPGESEWDARIGERTTVTEDYFALLEQPIVRGRAFTAEEVRSQSSHGERPAIISASTARSLWPGVDPIGRTLLARPAGLTIADDTLRVVGVAADAQVSALGSVDPYHLYVPGEGPSLFVKSQAGFATTASGIYRLARDIDPMLALQVRPLEATLGWWRGISGTVASLFSGLGVLALVLAAVGIYGVVAYTVSGRRREIGIRLALGATAGSVLGLMLRRTMRPVVAGAAIGLGASLSMSRLLSSVLFGVSPVDPVGLGGAALLVLVVALAAGVFAARPAAGADPTAALRSE